MIHYLTSQLFISHHCHRRNHHSQSLYSCSRLVRWTRVVYLIGKYTNNYDMAGPWITREMTEKMAISFYYSDLCMIVRCRRLTNEDLWGWTRSSNWCVGSFDLRGVFVFTEAQRILHDVFGCIRHEMSVLISSCPAAKWVYGFSWYNAFSCLKKVYESTTSSTFLHAGSSSMSLSMKNNRGMSTSSPASSLCSSKQKHSTLEK